LRKVSSHHGAKHGYIKGYQSLFIRKSLTFKQFSAFFKGQVPRGLQMIDRTRNTEQELTETLAIKNVALKALRKGDYDFALKAVERGEASIPDMVEDLKIYQAELEVQNDELRTAQLNSERALRRFNMLFSSLPLPALVIDEFGVIGDSNEVAESMFNLDRKFMRSHFFPRLMLNQEQVRLRRAIEQAKLNGDESIYEVEMQPVEGKKLIADIHLSLMPDYELATPHFSVLVVDQTERLQNTYFLKKEKEKFELLMQTSGDGIHLIDTEGDVVEVNNMFCKMLGYSRDELLKMNVTQWDGHFSPEGLREKLKENFAESQIFETKHRRKDGALIDVEISAKSLDYDGRMVLWNSARDITIRKEFEDQLKSTNAELEQFSYAVSHDLRQPLRMVTSYLQLLALELGESLDQEKQGYFNYAVDGAKRVDQMLQALLEYSRVGRIGDPFQWINSRVPFEEAMQFLYADVTKAQAEISVSGEWPRIFASPNELTRLFQNLIDNAVKYRIAGRAVKIEVTSRVEQDEWRLCIADNGVGIIPDQINRLFKVFQRLHTRAEYEGTGIGLALCRKIVEHHHGKIRAESEGEGKGSQFYVALPINQAEN
jgi:PAS domain S-box-containing protein